MTRFTEKATAITPNRELQPDEYFNETDHLIYCSKCNTPRQCRHELQTPVNLIYLKNQLTRSLCEKNNIVEIEQVNLLNISSSFVSNIISTPLYVFNLITISSRHIRSIK